ncbi:MAG TPA: NAD+ synthase [Candidatus Acidoferrales bacterium]|nr:NAD+ synthase [Candidatus Acidoferrales bacterium]
MDRSRARPLRIALAQFNPVVGDLDGNTKRMVNWVERSRELGADLIAFPEMCVTGYPPEDLLLKPSFIRDNLRFVRRLVDASQHIAVVAGFVDLEGDIYNAAAFCNEGELKGVYHKVHLPNYGVFDEDRYFQRGRRCPVFEFAGVRIGVSICEDAWYSGGPLAIQATHGAQLLININGSPYHVGKRSSRETMIATRAMDSRAYLAWVNMTGGQDELVFDGNSAVFSPDGTVIARSPSFEEDLLVCDLDMGEVLSHRLRDTRVRSEARGLPEGDLLAERVATGEHARPPDPPPLPSPNHQPLEGPAEVYCALVVGTADYVRKTGAFSSVVLGLSGGIDSSLTAAIAVDALGPENVVGVLMPSAFTSSQSLEDADQLARALGISTRLLPIDGARAAYEAVLRESFDQLPPGTAEENLQARIRGNLLMALSNKFGWMVLTTGNKSELATGYCTLYGDMAGGFAVLKDIPKTLVYELCRYRNSIGGPGPIPSRVMSKPPSAELRPDQVDEDSLPPYPELDPILRGYVEEDRSVEELIDAGHDPATVCKVVALVDTSEYKRRQGAPGIKITTRAFGRDRRMPITNRYRPEGFDQIGHPTQR